MTLTERADKAVELKTMGGYNCAQAVTAVLADQTSLTDEQLKQVSAGFCVGMGNLEATCGALIGAVMVAGMITDGKGTPRYSKELVSKFNDKCGATICKDLKGITTGKVLCECPDCVRNAVISLGEVIDSI